MFLLHWLWATRNRWEDALFDLSIHFIFINFFFFSFFSMKDKYKNWSYINLICTALFNCSLYYSIRIFGPNFRNVKFNNNKFFLFQRCLFLTLSVGEWVSSIVSGFFCNYQWLHLKVITISNILFAHCYKYIKNGHSRNWVWFFLCRVVTFDSLEESPLFVFRSFNPDSAFPASSATRSWIVCLSLSSLTQCS